MACCAFAVLIVIQLLAPFAWLKRRLRTGDFRRTFVEGPSERTLEGPVVTDVRYPEVPVARVFSRGEDLDLVLYPGGQGGRQALGRRQLQPNRSCAVTGAETARITADASGGAELNVQLESRTAINLTPLQRGLDQARR